MVAVVVLVRVEVVVAAVARALVLRALVSLGAIGRLSTVAEALALAAHDEVLGESVLGDHSLLDELRPDVESCLGVVEGIGIIRIFDLHVSADVGERLPLLLALQRHPVECDVMNGHAVGNNGVTGKHGKRIAGVVANQHVSLRQDIENLVAALVQRRIGCDEVRSDAVHLLSARPAAMALGTIELLVLEAVRSDDGDLDDLVLTGKQTGGLDVDGVGDHVVSVSFHFWRFAVLRVPVSVFSRI